LSIKSSVEPVSGYCLGLVLDSYKRFAPRGQLLDTSDARVERDALLLAWAMSNNVYEIALDAMGTHSGIPDSQTLESTVAFGQILGSIEACETLLQQHLTMDPSLFVVNELVLDKEPLIRHRIVAWVLKLARDEISKSLQRGENHNRQVLEERLKVQTSALAMPTLKGASLGRPGRSRPGEAAIKLARRCRTGLHPKAADSLRIHDGLRRLAPFALRRILSDTLFDRLGEQQLLELAGGLALAEALSIASGHPLLWNFANALDGVIAKVGPFSVRWHKPSDFDDSEGQSVVSATDTRTNACISFIRCADASGAAFENDCIRRATESLVTACRKESKKGPRFAETPLSDCAVIMRRLFNYEPEVPISDQLIVTEFDELVRGSLLDLAGRVCKRASLT
jgi:hypothetical protein